MLLDRLINILMFTFLGALGLLAICGITYCVATTIAFESVLTLAVIAAPCALVGYTVNYMLRNI